MEDLVEREYYMHTTCSYILCSVIICSEYNIAIRTKRDENGLMRDGERERLLWTDIMYANYQKSFLGKNKKGEKGIFVGKQLN